jgi:linoleoyl-CoA desaturase
MRTRRTNVLPSQSRLKSDSQLPSIEDEDELPIFEYRDVGAHNSEKSAFVVYDRFVYDITDFLRFHPGGKSILVPNLGTDITDTLDSFHDVDVSRLLRTSAHRRQYGIHLVGELACAPANTNNRIGRYKYQSRREYQRPDAMAAELKKEVFGYLREAGLPLKKPGVNCLALLVFFYVLYAFGVYMAFIQGSALWCLLLGPIATFFAVNVSHTIMHGGFSDSKIVNMLGRTFWDAGGYSARGWDVEHSSHHQAPHTTIDAQTADAAVIRFFKHQEFKWFHRYQIFYIWFVFVLYSPNSWVVHSYNTLFKYECVPLSDKVIHIVAKALGFVLPIGLSFYLLDAGTAFRNLFLFAVSMSYSTLFLLFIQHEDSYLPEDQTETWSVRQVTTSATWYTSNFVLEWLLGYFNYHIEHHLFPGLDPALYPKIQPIVRSVCERYGVRYKHISYFELVRSQVRAWRKYSLG